MRDKKAIWCELCSDWISPGELRQLLIEERWHYLCPGCDSDLLPPKSRDVEGPIADIEPLQPPLASYVKIRIEGLPADVEMIAASLAALFTLAEGSKNYPNRGNDRIRRYLTIEKPR